LFERGATLVNTCHNMGSRLAGRRLRILYRGSLARTRGIAMVGRQVREQLESSGIVRPGRSEVIHNGIPLPARPQPDLARDNARAALGLSDADGPVIGCVGRLVALKNHRVLLEQVPALLEAFPGLQV